jgi:hypothetical protein
VTDYFRDAFARSQQAASDADLFGTMGWPTTPKVERTEQRNIGLPGSIDADYAAWRGTADGQRVYAAVVDRAIGLVAGGATRLSIGALVEWVRSTLRLSVNNDYRALIARELVDSEPGLAELIEMRTRKAA